MEYIDRFGDKLKQAIGHKRYEHSIRVMETAIALANHYNINEEQAAIAGLLHDCGKFQEHDLVLKRAYDFDIILDDTMMNNPALVHGYLGAELAKREYGIEDSQILSAIIYHTTGKEAMTPLEKVIYLADYIEPDRSFPGVEPIRQRAYENLDEALIKAMNHTIKFVIDQGLLLHIDTLKARNDLILKKAK